MISNYWFWHLNNILQDTVVFLGYHCQNSSNCQLKKPNRALINSAICQYFSELSIVQLISAKFSSPSILFDKFCNKILSTGGWMTSLFWQVALLHKTTAVLR